MITSFFILDARCVLPWYWMGFATRKIVIRERVWEYSNCYGNTSSISASVTSFWRWFYQQIFLEFMYVNKTPFSTVILDFEDAKEVAISERIIEAREEVDSASEVVLVPLGGA